MSGGGGVGELPRKEASVLKGHEGELKRLVKSYGGEGMEGGKRLLGYLQKIQLGKHICLR